MYDVFSRIVSDDTAKIVSASWTNGCEAYVAEVVPELGEHAFPGGRYRRAVDLRRHGGPGLPGLQRQRCHRRDHTGADPVAQAVDPSTGTLYIANKTSNSVSVDSEGGDQRLQRWHGLLGVDRGWLGSGCRGARSVDRKGVRRQQQQHAHRVLDQYVQSVDDEWVWFDDADLFGWPSQRSYSIGRERVDVVRGERQRDGGGVQRVGLGHHLGGDGQSSEPALAAHPDPDRHCRRFDTRHGLRRGQHEQQRRILQRRDLQREHHLRMFRSAAVGLRRSGSRRSGCRRRGGIPLRGQCRARRRGLGRQLVDANVVHDDLDQPALERDGPGAVDRPVSGQPRSARGARRPGLSRRRDGNDQHDDPVNRFDGWPGERVRYHGSVGE